MGFPKPSWQFVRSIGAILGLSWALGQVALPAQAGDRKDPDGTVQAPPPADLDIPPAPVRSPEEELASFSIEPGYRIELAAAEPMVEDPVAIAFDAAGRMWVVEMRGIMRNVEGEGEREPVGRIAVLRDSDGDGRFDLRHVYLDGLALPRAVLPLGGGEALVLAPPHFWHCKDTDGDLVCDTREPVGDTFQNGFTDPEHAANTPSFGLDGWIHFSNYPRRARYADGLWTWEPVAQGGQWGWSFDDFGTPWFNTNSDHLRAHLAPARYAARHPGLAQPAFANQRVGHSQEVWPGRITPGVNRGYQKGTLRDDFTLARFTAVCGPGVYRGAAIEEFRGQVFLPEPSANLVRREVVTADGVRFRGENALQQAEFWTSQDERFRPVNALTGPDGGLYVVDLYRGILQHRNYLTTYLRRQIEARGLDQGIHLGRIWRVVKDDAVASTPMPDLEVADAAGLVAAVASPNGVVRDLAQREIARRGVREAAAPLRALVGRAETSPEVKVAALWTLDGIGQLDRSSLLRGFQDADARVREHAVRLAEARLGGSDLDAVLLGRLIGAAQHETAPRVVMQLAFSLGGVSPGNERMRDAAETALLAILGAHGGEPVIRDAVVSGLGGRELRFLERLAADETWREESKTRHDVLRRIASAATGSRDGVSLLELMAFAARDELAWRREAVVLGIVDRLPKPGARPLEVRGDESVREELLSVLDGEAASKHAERLRESIAFGAAAAARPLTALEQSRLDQGRGLYAVHCQQCHQPSGEGLAGIAPPLRGSEWVLGSPARLTRIVLHGLTGPIEVDGKHYDFPTMPDHGRLPDGDLAAILTWLRRGWDHEAEPVTVEQVKSIRAAESSRSQPWTAAELQTIAEGG